MADHVFVDMWSQPTTVESFFMKMPAYLSSLTAVLASMWDFKITTTELFLIFVLSFLRRLHFGAQLEFCDGVFTPLLAEAKNDSLGLEKNMPRLIF